MQTLCRQFEALFLHNCKTKKVTEMKAFSAKIANVKFTILFAPKSLMCMLDGISSSRELDNERKFISLNSVLDMFTNWNI